MRCCSAPANPVLCNRCEAEVKCEFRELVEEILADADKRNEEARRSVDFR